MILKVSLFHIGFFTHFSDKAIENYLTIQAMAPSHMSWNEVYLVLAYTGTWVKYPFAVLLALMGTIALCLNKKSLLYRKFSMDSLAKHNQNFFPCIYPVVGKGKALQTIESYDLGLWQIARTPAQFCVEHQLVNYADGKEIPWEASFKHGIANMDLPAYGKMLLQKNNCQDVFTAQLGHKKRAFHELPILRQALVTAFLAYGNDDKETALSILNTCSLSFVEDEKSATCKCFSDKEFLSFIKKNYDKYGQTHSKLIVRHSSFELPWIMSLLYFARKKGILAPSQFLFVRPIDRPLWYALHQCGGQVAWSEALAPWLHYNAEERAEKTLDDFSWEDAHLFMENTLASQGWLEGSVSNE